MPYLLDGDNLVGVARRGRGSAEDRDALVREVADRLRRTRARVVLFFDGAGKRLSLGNLSVEFAGAVTGDDAIVRAVAATSPAAEAVVVTADRELARRVRDAGGRAIPPEEFWSRFGAKPPSESRRADERVDVDDWMRWLSDEGNRER